MLGPHERPLPQHNDIVKFEETLIWVLPPSPHANTKTNAIVKFDETPPPSPQCYSRSYHMLGPHGRPLPHYNVIVKLKETLIWDSLQFGRSLPHHMLIPKLIRL